MMRALIVDDEIYARQELETLLKETGEFTIAGKCANGVEAMQAIKKEKPDVLFLDVPMPVINGFELLSMIDEAAMPRVVFVTAYHEYALKALEEHALDYLLKPVEKGRLAKTVENLKKRSAEGGRPVFAGPAIQQVPCFHSSKIKLINTAEIEYVRSGETGVHVISPAGEFYTKLTLQVLENRTNLIRCHKQFLKTKSGHLVPVSRRYLRVLRKTAILKWPCTRGRWALPMILYRRLTDHIDRSVGYTTAWPIPRTASCIQGYFPLTKGDCGY